MKATMLFLLVLSLTTLAAQTPARPRAAAPLTAQDYVDIEQLYARYAHGIDTGADNGNLLANVYTDDGFFANQAAAIAEGHEGLRTRWGVGTGAPKPPTGTGHWTYNVTIEPAPWGAVGRAYVAITRAAAAGQPATIGNGGIYMDTLVKTSTGWRFRARHFVEDWKAPPAPVPAPAAPSTR